MLLRTMSNDITSFTMKFFDVQARPRKVSRIEQVNWCMPSVGWVKANTDGVVRGCPGHVGSGDIFKRSVGEYIGGCGDYGCYFGY